MIMDCFWLEKAMAPHSSTLAWKIPWTEEPGRLQSMGSLGVRHDWVTSLSLFTFMHWRRKWQPTPVLLPGESQGRGNLVGCHLWGHTELDTTEVTYQQQQPQQNNFNHPIYSLSPYFTVWNCHFGLTLAPNTAPSPLPCLHMNNSTENWLVPSLSYPYVFTRLAVQFRCINAYILKYALLQYYDYY